ncbi:GNAT family N-acetyltransferase [Lutibacter citreus]|uniref:GNAT family N-acetyltransferase n=1 Tax=Lutibacter citreus TaxID=2138210 RepID=UPI000DBE640E|nr:GNAT family N-acetyltransferase [Lutibacter citreus]
MKIEKAVLSDLEQLYCITTSCAKHMESQGIFQWNAHYPSKNVLQNDLQLNQLWKLVKDRELIGIIVLTNIVDEEYHTVKWNSESSDNLYIHRLAVHPKFQGKGYAQKLMNFAEKFAVENKYTSIRLDTFSKNKRNQHFYEKRNYIKLESIYFQNQSSYPFYCYEKTLNV